MGYVKKDDVAGANIGNETVCFKCLSSAEFEELEAQQIIERDTVDDDDEGFYLCDRCGKSL